MDLTLSHAKLRKPLITSSPCSTFFLHCSKPSSSLRSFQSQKTFLFHLQGRVRIEKENQQRGALLLVHAGDISPSSNANQNYPPDAADRWLLVPVGDGDSRHIGFKVDMPAETFEIASGDVTVGRLPEKADIVIPVATVSGVHARIEKKDGNLLVTDLDSTNGTFIDDRRLRPGVVAVVSSGSLLTFGDTHLAMFRVSKLKNVGASETEESKEKLETK